MNKFRFFLESKLSKSFSENDKFQVINLGTIGWWNVSVASENEKIDKGYLSNNIDNLKRKVLSEFPSIAKESIQRMSYLGFRSQRHNLLIDDGIEKTIHPIVGVQVHPTYAYYQRHSIKMHINSMKVESLIHEHAHMVWNNLPKFKKKLFIDWFDSKKIQLNNSDRFISDFKDVNQAEKDKVKQAFDKQNLSFWIIENDIDDFVKIDPSLFTGKEWLKKYVDRLDSTPKTIENTPPISYYAPEKMVDQIKTIINKNLNNYISATYRELYEPMYFDADKIFNSFRAKLRLRKNKIKKLDDITNTLKEVLDKLVQFYNLKYTNSGVKNKHKDFVNNL